jgi:cytosine/adenosine deaminase-related metal-dependent hydrolase
MRKLPVLLLSLLFPVVGLAQGNPPSGAQSVIRNVNIVTLDERGVLSGASVVVSGGKIERILAKGENIPPDATVIDGAGGYLMPGMIDAHVHFGGEHELAGYLRYGVTTVFSLGTRQAGIPALIEARKRQASGALVGARLYSTGTTVPSMHELKTVAEVAPFMSGLQRDGFEFVKTYNEIPQDIFDEIVKEARVRGMGVFSHMPRRFPVKYTLTHGINVLAHMEELFFTKFQGPRDSGLDALAPDWMPDYSKIDPVLDLFAANDVAIIPNLVASYSFRALWEDEEGELSGPDAKYIDSETMESWRTYNHSRRDRVEKRMQREEIKAPLIRTLTYRAQNKGILLLAGTDVGLPALYPGRSLHQELFLMVSAGLTNEQALKAATVNGGIITKRYVDSKTCIGSVREGCEADLVLLRTNPLENIRNVGSIVGVMSDGKWYLRETLDRLALPPQKQ